MNTPLTPDEEIEIEKSGFRSPLVVQKLERDSPSPEPISRVDSKMSFDMRNNKSVQILEAARIGHYGILAAIA